MRQGLIAIALLAAACGSDTREDGASCVASDECGSGLCVTQFADGQVVDGGVCTQECEWGEGSEDTCPDGQVCLWYIYTDEKLCFLRCGSDDDCRTEDGWSCAVLDSSTSACIPNL